MAKIVGASLADNRRVRTDHTPGTAPQTRPLPVADLSAMRQAIRDRQFTNIDYNALSGEASRRRVCPLGLTLFDHAWLLTICCETAQAFRHLRADRINRFQASPERFRPESGKRQSD